MIAAVIDARSDWMKKEDQEAVCLWECSLYCNCLSKIGKSCRKIGGTKIPKVRGR